LDAEADTAAALGEEELAAPAGAARGKARHVTYPARSTDGARSTDDDNAQANSSVASVGVLTLPTLVDWTRQHRFYDSRTTRHTRNTLDVAIVWPPAPRYGRLADANRPPTRFHFWLL
jgi:hypothetical protein